MNVKDLEPVFIVASFSNKTGTVPTAAWIEKEDPENQNYILFTEHGEHMEFKDLPPDLFESMIVRRKEYDIIGFEGLMKRWYYAYDELQKLRKENEKLKKAEMGMTDTLHSEIIESMKERIEEVKNNPDKAREVIMNCGLYDENGELKDIYK